MSMLLFNVFGGLAVFIFGMKMMSDGLHKSAGERMKTILGLFTANRYIAIASGAVVTAVVQSSSATTTMVIGFVNAGLLNLMQSIGIIFGANVGTTITAQLVAFDINWLIMPAIMIGVGLSFVSNEKVRNWSEAIIGFGFIFLGMTFMGDELKGLADNPSFQNAFALFDCSLVNGTIPVSKLCGAILIGLVCTLVIQSSSACTGIIIAMGASGLLNLYTAVALVMGSNIGTTVTAQLAAIPANRVAKQTALAHTIFNTLGVILICLTFWIPWNDLGEPIFFGLVEKMSAGGALPRKIANAHTAFNIITTIVLIPLIPLLARFCEKVLPVKAKLGIRRLEPNLLQTPVLALHQTTTMLRHMLRKTWVMVDCALRIYNRNDAKNQMLVERLGEREKRIDEIQAEIMDYLSKLMLEPLSADQAQAIPMLIHCTNDVERIGDHTELVVAVIKKLKAAKTPLSVDAEQELAMLHAKLAKFANLAISLLDTYDLEVEQQAFELKRQIPVLCEDFETKHLRRLKKDLCSTEGGIFYIELLAEIRKVAHHIGNVVERAAFLKQY